jgi:hypothetical protein
MASQQQITTSSASSLPQHGDQRVDHRAAIGLRATTILAEFWRDRDEPDAQRALQIEVWMDVLEPFTQAEIRAAWAEYNRSGPRSERGQLLRPDPGALRTIILRNRPVPPRVASQLAPREPDRIPCPADKARAMLDEAGFTEVVAVALRKMPMATSIDVAVAGPATSQEGGHWSDGVPDDDPRMQRLRASRAQNRLMNPDGKMPVPERQASD